MLSTAGCGNFGILDLSRKEMHALEEEDRVMLKSSVQTINGNFSKNHLQAIPEELGLIPFVEILNFSNNILNTCEFVYPLPFLTILDLSFNRITNLSPTLFNLNSLVILILSNNSIKQIPNEVKNLINLQEIHFGSNKIEEICLGIYELRKLRVLNLSNNLISTLHPKIGDLANIETLDVSFNNLNSIHVNAAKCQNLRNLICIGNPISTPSPAICSMGTSAIKDYLAKLARPETTNLSPKEQILVLNELPPEVPKTKKYLPRVPVKLNPILRKSPPTILNSTINPTIITQPATTATTAATTAPTTTTTTATTSSSSPVNPPASNQNRRGGSGISHDNPPKPPPRVSTKTFESLMMDIHTTDKIAYVKMVMEKRLKTSLVDDLSLFSHISDGISLCKLIRCYQKDHYIPLYVPRGSEKAVLPYDLKKHNVTQFVNFCKSNDLIDANNNYIEEIIAGNFSKGIVDLVVRFIDHFDEIKFD